MKKIFLVAIGVCMLAGIAHAFDNNDFQVWATGGAEWQASKRWKLAIEEEFRFGEDSSNFYYQHTDAGLSYALIPKWLYVGSHYRQIFEKKKGKWRYENRPHLNATVKADLKGVTLSDRSRFEYRDKENDNDGWRYRNKMTIKAPKMTKYEFRPYVADEIFFDFDASQMSKNRTYLGVSAKIFKHLKGEVFFLKEFTKSAGKWKSVNALGTKLRLAF